MATFDPPVSEVASRFPPVGFELHELKTVQPWFEAIWRGDKKAELRINDRNFKVGDFISLREYHKDTRQYSGRAVAAQITHIIGYDNGPWLSRAYYVMFSFHVLHRETDYTPKK